MKARGEERKESLQRSLIDFHFNLGNPRTLQSVKTVTANVPQIIIIIIIITIIIIIIFSLLNSLVVYNTKLQGRSRIRRTHNYTWQESKNN